MKGQDQLYGHIKMEIILELECGLVAEFEPDWELSENHSDQTKVRWQLQYDGDQESLASLFSELETEESIPKSNISLANLRLLYGYNP